MLYLGGFLFHRQIDESQITLIDNVQNTPCLVTKTGGDVMCPCSTVWPSLVILYEYLRCIYTTQSQFLLTMGMITSILNIFVK